MTTRNRILITAVVIPLIFLILAFLQLPFAFYDEYRQVIILSILALVMMILVAWIVNFNLKGERIFTVLVFPALSLVIVTGFLDLVIRTSTSTLDRISTTITFAIILGLLTYVLAATINILNLAAVRNIPLGQAARAAHYVLTMVFSYFAFVLIVNLDIAVLIKSIIIFGLVFAYSFVSLWTISLAYSQRFISALTMAIVLTFLFLVLAIWPINSFYYALIMTLIYYMNLGMALEIREIIKRSIWLEYLVIFVAVMIILFSTASWGINGTIF